MALLPDLVARVQAVAKPDDTIMLMCRSGARSAIAVNMLAKAGFTKAYNIVDGMEGDTAPEPGDPGHGKHTVNGWKNAGCPWTYAESPDGTPIT